MLPANYIKTTETTSDSGWSVVNGTTVSTSGMMAIPPVFLLWSALLCFASQASAFTLWRLPVFIAILSYLASVWLAWRCVCYLHARYINALSMPLATFAWSIGGNFINHSKSVERSRRRKSMVKLKFDPTMDVKVSRPYFWSRSHVSYVGVSMSDTLLEELVFLKCNDCWVLTQMLWLLQLNAFL